MIKATKNAVRIKDIALKAGVSYPVASLALSGKKSRNVKYSETTRQLVLEVAEEMGYRPNRSARNFVNKRHGCIALVTDSMYQISRMALNFVTIAAMEQDCIVFLDRAGKKRLPRCLKEDMADGVIIFGYSSEHIHARLDELAIPTVRVNTNRTEGNGVITYDEQGGMKMLVEAFAKKGRKRIGMLSPGEGGHYSQTVRKKALFEYSREFGLAEPAWCFIDMQSIRENDLSPLVNDNPEIDAWITPESYLPKIYHACQENKREIGKDISVLCHDPEWTAEVLHPVCGGIEIDQISIGEKAIEVLSQIISGEKIPTQTIPYNFKTGNSL